MSTGVVAAKLLSVRDALLGLGVAAASLTAYRDLVLGVKSTLFAEPEPAAVASSCFGVAPAWPSVKTELDFGLEPRDGRRMDFRPLKVGSLEARAPVLGVAA